MSIESITPANPAQVMDAMVEAAMSAPPIPGRGPNVFDPDRMRSALAAAIGAGGQVALAASPAPVPDAVRADWQRIDDVLVSCASLIRALAKDDIAAVAAAELDYVRSALAANHMPVGDGYVLVPKEPTSAMLWADPNTCTTHAPSYRKALWSAMLAAARAGEDGR